mgnify:CR=1 FL=1
MCVWSLVSLGFYCYGARTSGRGPLSRPWGEDSARRRRDGTANVTLAVLGAGDWCRGARLGAVACVRALGLRVQGCSECGFCRCPKNLTALCGEGRECSGDAGTIILKQGRGPFATPPVELEGQPE